ncbi:hypothetical protein PIB30_084635 [Stylosanthes scabra]|uniref:Uncharacterized protein n=1 Tax=Stylosanthes scabra TaxID=79078 RepID=A0ABU6ST68_9FABA|nr:hypothetical protein [Stylosanthes scabra]
MKGNKLNRTFRVTYAKCGAQGHNYKTCKGPPANPGWKLRTSRKKKTTGGSTSNTSHVEVPLSQSAPAPEGQQGQSQDAPPLVISAPMTYAPFKTPAQISDAQPFKRLFRAKQPVRRNLGRSSPPPSEPPTSSRTNANSSLAGPSAETMAAASAGTQRILAFMATPRLQRKKK